MAASLPALVGTLNDRLRVLERQTLPWALTGSVPAYLADDGIFGVAAATVQLDAAPTGLDVQDAGTEWLNTTTGVVQWWDGWSWRAGNFPYVIKANISVLGMAALAAGRTFFDYFTSSTAPATPAIGDIWDNSSSGVYSQWQGSWHAINDVQMIAYLNEWTIANYRVFFTPSAPTAIHLGDYWFETDNNFYWRVWSNSWNPVPEISDEVGQVITAATFQTSDFGQRMEMSADTVGGVIKFWTGSGGETAGYLNPGLGESGVYPAVEMRSPVTGTASNYARIMLQSGISQFNNTPFVDLKAPTGFVSFTGASPATRSIIDCATGDISAGRDVLGANLRASAGWTTATVNLGSGGNFTSTAATLRFTLTGASSSFVEVGGGSVIAGKIGSGSAQVAFSGGAIIMANNVYNAVLPTTATNVQPCHADSFHTWGAGLIDETLSGGGTTGASFGNGGRAIRTSTKEMKEAIRPMTAKEAHSVLGLESYTGRYKDEDAPDQRRYPFFIAEQGAEVGAELWVARQHKVTYNEKTGKRKITRDRQGKPIAFRTAEITVAHNVLIKELTEKVDKQQQIIDDLVARVAALEGGKA